MAIQQLLMMGTQSFGRTTISGELWAWGYNNVGQLGLGNTTTSHNSHLQVGSLTDWQNNIAGGGVTPSVYCVKSDGTLWAWGSNSAGKLGLGDTTNRSSPTQIGSDTDWKEVGNGVPGGNSAIKTDGTLWSWGSNWHATLGDGTETDTSSPIQIGSDTDWGHIVAYQGNVHYMCAATKTDGTLWWWGSDTTQSGYRNDNSSPTQIGSDSDWTDVIGFAYQHNGTCYAIKEA